MFEGLDHRLAIDDIEGRLSTADGQFAGADKAYAEEYCETAMSRGVRRDEEEERDGE